MAGRAGRPRGTTGRPCTGASAAARCRGGARSAMRRAASVSARKTSISLRPREVEELSEGEATHLLDTLGAQLERNGGSPTLIPRTIEPRHLDLGPSPDERAAYEHDARLVVALLAALLCALARDAPKVVRRRHGPVAEPVLVRQEAEEGRGDLLEDDEVGARGPQEVEDGARLSRGVGRRRRPGVVGEDGDLGRRVGLGVGRGGVGRSAVERVGEVEAEGEPVCVGRAEVVQVGRLPGCRGVVLSVTFAPLVLYWTRGDRS